MKTFKVLTIVNISAEIPADFFVLDELGLVFYKGFGYNQTRVAAFNKNNWLSVSEVEDK